MSDKLALAADSQGNPGSRGTTLDQLVREGQLLTYGIGGAVADVVNHPLDKLPEVGTSVALGASLGAISRGGASGKYIAAAIGGAMLLKLGVDEITGGRWSSFFGAAKDTWNTDANMDRNIAISKNSLGAFAVDMGLGAAGFKLGGALSGRYLDGLAQRPLAAKFESGSPANPSLLQSLRNTSLEDLASQRLSSGPADPALMVSLREASTASFGDLANQRMLSGPSNPGLLPSLRAASAADAAGTLEVPVTDGIPITAAVRAANADPAVLKEPAWGRGPAIRGVAGYVDEIRDAGQTAHPMVRDAVIGKPSEPFSMEGRWRP